MISIISAKSVKTNYKRANAISDMMLPNKEVYIWLRMKLHCYFEDMLLHGLSNKQL